MDTKKIQMLTSIQKEIQTLAFPASDQFVTLLALAVVRAHVVEALAPQAARRPLTLINV